MDENSKKVLVYVRLDGNNDARRTVSFEPPPEIPALWWLEEADGDYAIDGNRIVITLKEYLRGGEVVPLSEVLAGEQLYLLGTFREHGYEVEFV